MLARLSAVCLILMIVIAMPTAATYKDSQNFFLDESREVTLVAVAQQVNGSYVGVAANLHARVSCPGRGHVYVETYPLSEIDLQASARVAALVAAAIANVSFWACDYFISIVSESPIVGGPSASAAISVAFAAALLRLPLNASVVITGMVLPDGSVGPVGGLKYKLEAAASRGAKVFLVPHGQSVDTTYVVETQRVGPVTITRVVPREVDLIKYGASLGVKVIPVASIYEALEVFTNGLYEVPHSGGEVMSMVYESLTPLLGVWSETLAKLMNDVLERYSEYEARARSTGAWRYISEHVNVVKTSALRLKDVAEELAAKGRHYAAASAYFNGLVYAYWGLYLVRAAAEGTKILSMERAEAQRVANEILQEILLSAPSRLSLPALSALLNTVNRVYEAMMYINRSSVTESLLDATHYLAYASARLASARLWLGAVNASAALGVGITLSRDDLLPLSVTIEALVRNVYSYLLAFAYKYATPSQGSIDEMEERYDLLLKARDPLVKTALGLSTLSYIYLATISMFKLNLSAAVEALNRTIWANAAMLREAMPVDAPLMIELAKVLEDYEDKLYVLSQLSMTLMIYKVLLSEVAGAKAVQPSYTSREEGAPQTVTVPVEVPVERVGLTTMLTLLLLVLVAVLFLIAAFLPSLQGARQ